MEFSDSFLVSAVSFAPEESELETPVLAISEGMLSIVDPNRILLGLAVESFFDGVDLHLAILVSQ